MKTLILIKAFFKALTLITLVGTGVAFVSVSVYESKLNELNDERGRVVEDEGQNTYLKMIDDFLNIAKKELIGKTEQSERVLSKELLMMLQRMESIFRTFVALVEISDNREIYVNANLIPQAKGVLLTGIVKLNLQIDTYDEIYSFFDFSGATLNEADLSGAYLRGVNLQEADLRNTSLSDAILREADLGGANLSGAILQGTQLVDANLSGANLLNKDYIGVGVESGVYVASELFKAHSLYNCKNLDPLLMGVIKLERPCVFTPEGCPPYPSGTLILNDSISDPF